MAQHGIPVYNLPLLREWRGLTQGQLARATEVGHCTLWLWEQGKAHPLAHNVHRLAGALGVAAGILQVEHPKAALTLARLCDPRPATAGGVLRWEMLIARIAATIPSDAGAL